MNTHDANQRSASDEKRHPNAIARNSDSGLHSARELATDDRRGPPSSSSPHILWLSALAVLQAFIYREVAQLSRHFSVRAPFEDRPILAVLILFFGAFVSYLVSVWIAQRAAPTAGVMAVIIGAGIVFRLLLVGTVPIQEVDIYRYVWDGVVSDSGVSPYRYTPKQVMSVNRSSSSDQDLRKLAAVIDLDPAVAEICRQVHFGQLPTIYPPVSQWVFARVVDLQPSGLSIHGRLVAMKSVFCLFDLGTLAVVIALLQFVGLPVTLALIYAWCPLLMKEVANSGHLDAVAVFLTALAVLGVTLSVFPGHGRLRRAAPRRVFLGTALSAGVFALAIAAKLYPIVLAPALVVIVWRRVGARCCLLAVLVSFTTLVGAMRPMLIEARSATSQSEFQGHDPAESLDEESQTADETRSTDGLEAFLRTWEINDFIFLVLVENFKPAAYVNPGSEPWFVVAPDAFRTWWCETIGPLLRIAAEEIPFMTARALTVMASIGIALVFAWRLAQQPTIERWLSTVFLTIAWFWLLCPTQNPWYWTWALPFLPFARARSWILVSGIVLVYYARFWLIYQWPDAAVVPPIPYAGASFFDLIVTWLEFAPWLLLLAIETMWSRTADRPTNVQSKVSE